MLNLFDEKYLAGFISLNCSLCVLQHDHLPRRGFDATFECLVASAKAKYAGYIAVPTLRYRIARIFLRAESSLEPFHGDPHVPFPDILG